MRASFLGHVFTELILDACLVEARPQVLDDYYVNIGAVDPARVTAFTERLLSRPLPRLGEFIELFRRERFLADYTDDHKLCTRVDQVLRRVRLPSLPSAVTDLVPDWRDKVRRAQHELASSADRSKD